MPKKNKGKFTDSELIKLAEEEEALKARIAKLQLKADKLKKSVLAEMIARQTKSLTHGGRSLTFVQATRVVLHEDQLMAELDKAQTKAVTSTRLDRSKLTAAVQRGIVPAALVDVHSEVVDNAPYYRLS